MSDRDARERKSPCPGKGGALCFRNKTEGWTRERCGEDKRRKPLRDESRTRRGWKRAREKKGWETNRGQVQETRTRRVKLRMSPKLAM